jgi:hypothetical protein
MATHEDAVKLMANWNAKVVAHFMYEGGAQ